MRVHVPLLNEGSTVESVPPCWLGLAPGERRSRPVPVKKPPDLRRSAAAPAAPLPFNSLPLIFPLLFLRDVHFGAHAAACPCVFHGWAEHFVVKR